MRRVLVVLSAWCLLFTMGGNEGKAASATSLVLTFDGGFAYLFSKEHKTVDVAAVKPHKKNVPPHHLKFGIPMTAAFEVVSGAKPKIFKVNGVPKLKTWDFTGFDVSLEPGGKPVGVKEVNAPAAAAPGPCKDVIGADANNLGYLADLLEFKPGGQVDASAIGARLQLRGGTLNIAKAGYCWQFENKTEKRTPQSLVQGLEGIRYELPVSGDFVDLVLMEAGTNTIKGRIRLKPDSNGVIAGRLSTWFMDNPTKMVKEQEFDRHFDMFYSLFKADTMAGAAGSFQPRFVPNKPVPTSPGNDCLSIRIGAF